MAVQSNVHFCSSAASIVLMICLVVNTGCAKDVRDPGESDSPPSDNPNVESKATACLIDHEPVISNYFDDAVEIDIIADRVRSSS